VPSATTSTGIPAQGIRTNIFAHGCAIVPAFGLRLHQQPAGAALAGLRS